MQILSNLSLYGTLGLNSVADANTDTDKFLVMDSNGIVKYRTGQELYNDIGAGGAAAYTSVLQHEVKASVALNKGQAVYVTTADGTNMIVGKASNASEPTSSKTLGLVAQNLAINDIGFVVTEGLLAGIDTSTALAGDPVWLGTDGNLLFGLSNKPHAPAHMVFIGIVTRVQQNNGEIFVKVQNGFELDELHNVQITSTPSDNAVLAYELSSGLYKMKSIPTLLGYTPVTDARTLTINGTSYNLSSDRAWSIDTGVMTASAGLGISLSIVNQNLNIVNTGILTASAGSGISLSVVNQNLNVVNTGILTASAGSGISLSVVGQNLNVINTGILTASAGSGISLSVVGQNLNVINTGVITASAGAGISLSIVGGNLNVVNTITNNNQLTNGAGYITSSSLSGYVQGSGSSGQVTYWNGSSSQTGSNSFFWDASNNRLGIGLTNPQRRLEIYSATADSHLRLSGSAPSVSLGEAITGSIYQAKFGLATASSQYSTSAAAGDFVIISQTGATIWVTGTTDRLKLFYGGNFSVGGSADSGLAKLQVVGAIQQSSVTSSMLKVDANGVLVAATSGSDFLAPGALSSYVPTSRTITINGVGYDLSADRSWTIAAGVSSFNTRTGAITLTSGDVTGALGYTPYNSSNPSGYITSAALSGYAPNNGSFSDANALTTGGFFTAFNASNVPSGLSSLDMGILNIPLWGGNSGGERYTMQLFANLDTNTNFFIRKFKYFGSVNQSTWYTLLHSGNYNSYSPTLTGGNASGTWGINITGNASTASIAVDLNAADATEINFNKVTNTDYSTMTFMSRAWSAVQGANGLAYNFTTHTNGGSGGYGALQIYYGESGYVYAPTSFRAPIFYDSQDTGYYLDPNGISRVWGIAIRGDLGSTSTSNQIFFWGDGNSTTSAIGFKANGGSFTNPTGFGDGYNTYLTMDSDGRGWVFRRGVGGSDFGAAYTSGWILNNGVWQANASMRAPIFYDSNDTTYYVDPNSTSRLESVWVRGASQYDGRLYVGGSSAGSGLTMNFDQIWTGSGNLHLQYSGSGNIDMNYGGGYTFSRTSLRAPIFYDYNDTSYYGDFNDQSRFLALKLGNQSTFNSGATYALQISHNNRYLLGLNYNNSSYYPWLVNDSAGGYEALVFHFNGIGDKFYFNRAGNMNASGGLTAYSIQGNSNVGGTGSASYHPSGIYSTSTNWLYGTMYLNNNSIYDVYQITHTNASIKLMGNFHLDAYNGNSIYLQYYNQGATIQTYASMNMHSYSIVSATNFSANNAGLVSIGDDSATYTYVDSTRSRFYASSAYPVLTLNSTVTSGNSNHGPTIQFTHNGYDSNRQWVIGTPGTGAQLDIGTAQAANYNPHYGIAGLSSTSGKTIIRVTTSGYTGIGGNWGYYGSGDPSYPLHVNGYAYLNTNVGIATDPRTDGYKLSMGGSIHLNGNSVDYVGSLYFSGAGHIQPNAGSYGALQMTSSKNGWSGIRFTESEVNLMMNSNESGHYRNGYGWQYRWYNGSMYISTNSYGGGSEYTVLHTGNAPRASNSNLVYYAGFTLNADTMPTNSTGFTYSVNAPTTGPIVRFGDGNYDMELNSDYYWGNNLYFRGRNGDGGVWRSWRRLLNGDSDPYAANMNQYLRTYDNPTFNVLYASDSIRFNQDVSTDNTFGIYFSSNRADSYGIYREGGSWSWPYPDLRIAFHTGIKIGANAGYNGVRFYDDYTMANQVMSVNNNDDGYGGGNVFINNSLWVGSGVMVRGYQGVCAVYECSGSGNYAQYNPFGANGHDANYCYYWSIGSCGFSVSNYGAMVNFGTYNLYMGPSSGENFFYQGWNGDLCIGGYLYENAYSDCRYKDNITNIESALDKLDSIRGVEFDWNELGLEEAGREGHTVGVIAQEVQAVYPQAVREVSKERDNYTVTALVVDYDKLIPLLIQSIKELNAKVNNLKSQIDGSNL